MAFALLKENVQADLLISTDEPLVLLPVPKLQPGTAKWCQYAYESYVWAFVAVEAVYRRDSFHVALPEDKKAKLYAERMQRLRRLESIYLSELEKAKTNARRRASRKKADAAKAPQQMRLFVDAWPPAFTHIAERFPRRPRVSNDFDYGSTVRSLDSAAAYRYIQHNPPAFDHLLVIDYDAPAGIPVEEIWERAGLPEPSWIAKTPGTKKGHLVWALKTPVCSTNAARQKPLEYLARIEEGFRKALSGDRGYAGEMTKNPIHPSAWEIIWFHSPLYSLDELAATVDIKRYTDRFKGKKAEKPVEAVGIGRKVQTFNDTRAWAYGSIEPFWGGPFDFWHAAVKQQADKVNASFRDPLRDYVVRAIAKSIARWTWRKFTPAIRAQLIAATHTPEIQAKRGAKKGAVKREADLDAAKRLSAKGLNQRAIAEQLGVSQKTVSNWLRRAD